MARPALEIADIFRDHGSAWRQANAGHVSLGQLKVMSAIESCRTAALGGHVMRCEDCLHTQIAYNSCRNRHCPKCQGSQALAWLPHDREVPCHLGASERHGEEETQGRNRAIDARRTHAALSPIQLTTPKLLSHPPIR